MESRLSSLANAMNKIDNDWYDQIQTQSITNHDQHHHVVLTAHDKHLDMRFQLVGPDTLELIKHLPDGIFEANRQNIAEAIIQHNPEDVHALLNILNQ